MFPRFGSPDFVRIAAQRNDGEGEGRIFIHSQARDTWIWNDRSAEWDGVGVILMERWHGWETVLLCAYGLHTVHADREIEEDFEIGIEMLCLALMT